MNPARDAPDATSCTRPVGYRAPGRADALGCDVAVLGLGGGHADCQPPTFDMAEEPGRADELGWSSRGPFLDRVTVGRYAWFCGFDDAALEMRFLTRLVAFPFAMSRMRPAEVRMGSRSTPDSSGSSAKN